MPSRINFTIISVYDKEGINHWDWEITTRSVIIKNKKLITQGKNTCYKSLALQVQHFFRIPVDRSEIKERHVDENGNPFKPKTTL